MSPTSSAQVEVRIYTTLACPYCQAAKQLLQRRGIAFHEIDVTGDETRRRWLRDMTGRPTVPQVFFGSEAIGGFDELAALDRSRSLATRLGSAAAAPLPPVSEAILP